MNCISCGSHSGDGLLCPGCSDRDISFPVFNLIGNSIFTELRSHGLVYMDLGPSATEGLRASPLPSLGEELNDLSDRLDMGRDPAVLSHRFERLLVNAGMPELMSLGNMPLTMECSAAATDVMRLGQNFKSNGSKLSARTENILGNLAWLRSPALAGKRALDTGARNKSIAKDAGAALEHYDYAIASDPKYLDARKNRAMLLHRAGRYAESVEACKSVIEKKSDDSAMWSLMGLAYLHLGDLPEAIRCFDSSLKQEPKNPGTWLNKAEALMKMERFPEALACFDVSLRLEPANPVALNGKGDALTRIGSIDQAVEAYDRAKNLMPKPAFTPRKKAPETARAPAEPTVKPKVQEEPPAAPEPAEIVTLTTEIIREEETAEPEIPDEVEAPIPAQEEHPPEKMEKESFELKMEDELEKELDIENEDMGIDLPEEEDIPEPESVAVTPPKEKVPRSLAEMFMGGLKPPEDDDDAEEEEEDEWPDLPDEVDLPGVSEDDEPVLGPLMGIPTRKDDNGELSAEEMNVLSEIEEIENEQMMPDAPIQPEPGATDIIKNLIENSDYVEALKRTDAILARDPNNAELMALKGSILTDLERYDDALNVLNRAVETDPENSLAWLSRGELLCEMDEYGKAKESFESALKLERNNVNAWLKKGECQLYMEDYEVAIVSFNEVIERDRNNAEAWLGIGDAFMGLEREDDAYKCYDKVTALDPKSPEGWSRLGDVLISKGRWGGSLQMYERAIKVDAEFSEAYLSKAKIMMNRGMLDEADAVYSRMLEVFPTDLDGLTGKVEILIRKGKWGAALQSLRPVMRHHPDSARVWALQGDAYREQGNIDEAKIPYDEALELDPEEFTALLGKGRLMLDNGGYNEAIELFRKAIDVDSEDPFAWRFLGEAQKGIGKEKEALKSLEMATEMGDNNPDNWLAYGTALHESGRYPEAIEAFDRVTKIVPGHQEAVRWREQSTKRLLKEVS